MCLLKIIKAENLVAEKCVFCLAFCLISQAGLLIFQRTMHNCCPADCCETSMVPKTCAYDRLSWFCALIKHMMVTSSSLVASC